MRFFWGLYFVICLCPLARADSSTPLPIPGSVVAFDNLPKELVELTELMASSASFKARFIRSVYLKGQAYPINTQGRLVFDVDLGLLWQVLDPYKEALWLSEDGVFRLNSKGREKVFEDLGIFIKVREFVEGRLKDFAAAGDLTFGAVKDSWEISITPKNGTLAAQVQRITLRGYRALLTWVRVQEKSGRVISIRIYDLQRYEHSLGKSQFFFLEPRDDFLPVR